MLKEKITEWIGKTFGKPQHRDVFEMSSKISEKNNQGAVVLIEELNFVFQRTKTDFSQEDIERWKKELDEISGNSLIGFHFENGELFNLASPQDIQKGAIKGQIVTGRSTLLSVGIHKKTFIANAIVFPGKLNSNRRH